MHPITCALKLITYSDQCTLGTGGDNVIHDKSPVGVKPQCTWFNNTKDGP